MKLNPLFLGFAVLLSTPLAAVHAAPKPVKVFILAGQSNMEGQAVVDLEDSPNPGHGHHEFGNAETYFLVGDALGKGMVKLTDDGVLK